MCTLRSGLCNVWRYVSSWIRWPLERFVRQCGWGPGLEIDASHIVHFALPRLDSLSVCWGRVPSPFRAAAPAVAAFVKLLSYFYSDGRESVVVVADQSFFLVASLSLVAGRCFYLFGLSCTVSLRVGVSGGCWE